MHLIRRARCNLRLFLLFVTPSRPLGSPSLAGSTIHGLENSSSSNDTNSLIRKLSPKSNGCDDGAGDGDDETTPVKKSLASAKCVGPRVRMQLFVEAKTVETSKENSKNTRCRLSHAQRQMTIILATQFLEWFTCNIRIAKTSIASFKYAFTSLSKCLFFWNIVWHFLFKIHLQYVDANLTQFHSFWRSWPLLFNSMVS